MKPIPRELRVGEGFRNPVGFHDSCPTLSWRLPPGTGFAVQQSYRIVAATRREHLPDHPDLWDSQRTASGQSVLVPYGGEALASRQRVYWQVKVWNAEGAESGWSEPAFFEAGLLATRDWEGRWIRMVAAEAADADVFVPEYFRRPFHLEKPVASARLYATAKGMFRCFINGERVGEDELTPGWTAYAHRIETLTYDVTRPLRAGGNVLGAVLGEGWYAGRMMGKEYLYPEARPALLLQLEVCYTDCTTGRIVTDAAWKAVNAGPIRQSAIYDGEVYDARMELPGWSEPGYDDAGWNGVETEPPDPGVALEPKRHLPVRAIRVLAAQSISEPAAGQVVFDLGQNMVGRPRLALPVVPGRTLTMRFAEMLRSDGTLYTENYRSARSTDSYTAAAGGVIEWEPTFTFHGFRYVEITGLDPGCRPECSWVSGVVLHSDMQPVGVFTCSHEKLNRLQQNIVWGQRGNFLDIPTDCPQRDERLGWTGDAQVFCPTAMFNYDALAFFKSWLRTMRDEQGSDGSIPHVVPRTIKGAGAPGWHDAGVLIPWALYVRTGDVRLLADHFEMMERLVGWYRAMARDHLIHELEGFGDWLQPYARDLKGDTPMPLLGTAYYAHGAGILADCARILGRKEEAARYAVEAQQVKAAFAEHYFEDTGRLRHAPDTQTACLLALAFGLVPDGLRPRVADNLLRLIREADGHLRTGFLGTPHLAPVLDALGHGDLALSILLKESYPGWLYSVNQGATTMWERWNSYSHEHGFGDVNMNSFNHYAYGAIGQWMYERIAGLAPDPEQPGYRHFFVRPLLARRSLTHARAELDTGYGRAASGWRRTREGWSVEIEVPPNATATLELRCGSGVDGVRRKSRREELVPDASGRFTCGLAPGRHRFSVRRAR